MFQNTLSVTSKQKNKTHTPDCSVIVPWKIANNALLNVVAARRELLLHLHNVHPAEWLTATVAIVCIGWGLLSRISFLYFM